MRLPESVSRLLTEHPEGECDISENLKLVSVDKILHPATKEEVMTTPLEPHRTEKNIDVVVVGAGVAGMYALHHLRSLGYSCRVFDSAGGVGGTWYWNRYPGARVDIESIEYCYSFDKALQQEWDWTERYAAQPELLRYLNHVADRLDLRSDIQLDTRVKSQAYDEATNTWVSVLSTDEVYRSRFVVVATGFVSAPNKPKFEGLESFQGDIYFSGQWPHEEVDFTGRTVAMIGTGSSAVQMTPLIAKQAEKMFVFQRTAPFIVPLRNHAMDPAYLNRVRAEYDLWREKELESFGGYIALNYEMGEPLDTLGADVSADERLSDYESRWKNGGLSYYTSYFDLFTDKAINDTLADFFREKTLQRINNPELAKKLLPTSFPVLTKRLIADTNYYESFNENDITLVDVKDTPITRITEHGVQVGDSVYEVDTIVLATGYDAVTGAMDRIDIHGRGGVPLKGHWADGPRTHIGIMAAGFPNMFIIDGPGSPGAFFQPILLSEYQIRWVGNALRYLDVAHASAFEPTTSAEAGWVDHISEVANATLFPEAKSWYMGSNIPGKPVVSLMYLGGFQEYRRRLDKALNEGIDEYLFSHAPATVSQHADSSQGEQTDSLQLA